jgi:hypothetical protein
MKYSNFSTSLNKFIDKKINNNNRNKVQNNTIFSNKFLNIIAINSTDFNIEIKVGGNAIKFIMSDTEPLNPEEGLIWLDTSGG